MPNRVSAYLEQEILSASPLQLVHLLYQSAIAEIREARIQLAGRNLPAKCASISRASALVGEMLCSLNMDEGGEIAARLKALYEYILSRLLHANLRNLDEPLAEAIALLSTLDEGWKELAHTKTEQPSNFSHNFGVGSGMGTDIDTSTHAWTF